MKRSHAASFDAYKAELREVLRHQACTIGPLIDKTKVDVEEARLKIKEIVDYEGLSLQWLINCIRGVAAGIGAPGCNNSHLLNQMTPQPPMHLKSDQAPISRQSGFALKQEMQQVTASLASATPSVTRMGMQQHLHQMQVPTNASSYAAAAAKK